MDIIEIAVLVYFVVGLILSLVWWEQEYKVEYEYEKEYGEVESGMAILHMTWLMIFWPIKLLKNYIEGFIE